MATYSKNLSIKSNIVPSFYKKRFSYKLYYSSTDIRDVWGNEVLNDPTFRTTINGGAGEVVIKLARKVDAFGEGDDIVLNRQVDIYVYDRDQPQGLLLYRGFISGYTPILDGPQEYVEITILGYVVEIGSRILKDGAGNTTISYTDDPSNMMKDIIQKYRAEGGNLNYTSTSIDLTGISVTYIFTCFTIKEALDKVVELTPYGWYWRIDPDGTIYLKNKSATADHQLYIGKHIFYMSPTRKLDDLRNCYYFIGGTPPGQPQLYRKYKRISSVNTWGLKEEKYTDSRVTNSLTADVKATRFLDEKQEPSIITTLRVLDNNGENPDIGYDIESIKPGDTLAIANLKSSRKDLTLWDTMIWNLSNWDYEIAFVTADILHIMSTTYYPDYLELEAVRIFPNVPTRVDALAHELEAITTSTLPIKPVEGAV